MEHTILFVEDDISFRSVVAGKLERCGFKVATARDGAEALEYLRQNPQPPPDLILLDLRMPHLSGTEFLTALSREPHRTKIPVLVISALSLEDIKKRTNDFPVRGRLAKTQFSLNDLRSVILKHMDLPAAAAAAAAVAGTE